MALKIRMLIKPSIYRAAEEGEATVMVNNRTTYQQQSYILDAPEGMQVVFIPATYSESHPVPDIIKKRKLYFNLGLVSVMFTSSPLMHLARPTYVDQIPGIYIQQKNHTYIMSIKECMMISRYPSLT